MYSIDVIAAFDFLEKEETIGMLNYERKRGKPSYTFTYNNTFLAKHPRLVLSQDLGFFSGEQAMTDNLFRFLSDALPDRWGRALIDKREKIEARNANRIPREFDDFGYLIRIDDTTRMGALRFKYKGAYLGTDNGNMEIPPITTLNTFIDETHKIEEAERKRQPIEDKWIYNVWKQGSSLGGARPKMSIIDEDGNLNIAKIPSTKDTYDVEFWEHFASLLARQAGINAAKTRILRIGPTPYHTLLSQRFDRDGKKRIHFASSLTIAGLKDGDGAGNGKGYIDIVDAIVSCCGTSSTDENTHELFRRVAFNILIGNYDDHFRNHGFLLNEKGWSLSPAYDINPTNQTIQSLNITPYDNKSSIKNLLKNCEYYLISQNDAIEILKQTTLAVEKWRYIANNLLIPLSEQKRFEARFTWSLQEARQLFPKNKSITVPAQPNRKKKKGISF